MQNYIKPGDNITLPAPYDVSAGDGALVGSIFGVAQGDAVTAEDVVLVRQGVFTLAKTSAQAWTQGAKIYWDDTSKVATTTATSNTLIGAAHVAAANPSDTGEVVLDGAIR
jgi:predicted RecA/RadA family phage recombinase